MFDLDEVVGSLSDYQPTKARAEFDFTAAELAEFIQMVKETRERDTGRDTSLDDEEPALDGTDKYANFLVTRVFKKIVEQRVAARVAEQTRLEKERQRLEKEREEAERASREPVRFPMPEDVAGKTRKSRNVA